MKKERTHTLEYCRAEQQQLATIKFTRWVTQQPKIPNYHTNRTKNPPHRYWQKSSQRKSSWAAETTGAVLQPLRRTTITIATWRSTHPPVGLRSRHGSQEQFGDRLVPLDPQLEPCTTAQDLNSNWYLIQRSCERRRPLVNHPSHKAGEQPGQPVQLVKDVPVTRTGPIPVMIPPEPANMAKAGHGILYQALCCCVVTPSAMLEVPVYFKASWAVVNISQST